MFVRQDVTRESDWQRRPSPRRTLGGLHGLINNAGIYQPRTLLETDTELFERHMRVNQLGCFLGMKCVVPLMERFGRRFDRQHLIGGRPARLAGRDRLQRDEMGVARHDQGRGDRSRAAQDPGELGASRPDRYRDAQRPHAGTEPATACKPCR